MFNMYDEIRETRQKFWIDAMVNAFSGNPPPVLRCETDKELGMWFMCFAVACRAILPKD